MKMLFRTFAKTPRPYQPGGGIPLETRTEDPTFTEANHDNCLPAMPDTSNDTSPMLQKFPGT